jgi:hypothetical protein
MRFAHSYLPRAKNSPISEYSRIARDAVLPVAPVGGEDILFYEMIAFKRRKRIGKNSQSSD